MRPSPFPTSGPSMPSCSMRPAPGWERCAGIPSCAGAGARTTCSAWLCSSGGSSSGARSRSLPEGSSPTRCAAPSPRKARTRRSSSSAAIPTSPPNLPRSPSSRGGQRGRATSGPCLAPREWTASSPPGYAGSPERGFRLSSGASGAQDAHPPSSPGGVSMKRALLLLLCTFALPAGAMKTIVIHRAEEPNVTYVLHEASKTYSKLDANEAPVRDASKYTVKRLGKETIAGRSTDHVMISQGGGEATEVWVDTKLVSSSDLAKAFAGRGDPGGWWKALEKEGLAGVPLKLVSHDSSGKEKVVWEATKVEAKSVPSLAFEIPAGYTQGGAPGMGGAMNKLTPEQRKQLEEMMKQRQTGK